MLQSKVLREFSAGGVVYKKEGEEILWLITKSTPSELFPVASWRLPKGWLDDENDGKDPGPLARGDNKANTEDLEKAALREVSEEGGVEAKIVEKIMTEQYFITRGGEKAMKFVTYFLMEWIKDRPEGHDFETSEVAWLSYEAARKKLTHGSSKKILDEAAKLV